MARPSVRIYPVATISAPLHRDANPNKLIGRWPLPRSLARRYRGVESIRRELASKEDAIRARLADFREAGRQSDEALFGELCFCLLAIQTKARGADAALREIVRSQVLWKGDAREIAAMLRQRVRFHNHKATYIVAARGRFFGEGRASLRAALNQFTSSGEARMWLVAEVDGLGLKEASHFLRNIGRGEDLAILDRHVLRNLVLHGVIGRMPRSVTPRRYLEIESRMARFAESLGISVGVLDLIFWSRETGEIFK